MKKPEAAESEPPAAYNVLNLRRAWLTEYRVRPTAMTVTAAFLHLNQQVHSLWLSVKFHFQEMVSTHWRSTGGSASILGIALMAADWMGEQPWP